MSWFHNFQMSWHRVFQNDTDGLMQSRRALFAGNLIGTFTSNITAGTFYTALFLVLFRGQPESMRNEYIGNIALLQTIAGFLQMLAPQIVERLRSRKLYVMGLRWTYHFLNIVCLAAVPVLPFDIRTKANIFMIICTLMSVTAALYAPALSAWHIHPLTMECRSDFFTVQNMISSVSNHVTGLLAGLFMDFFAKSEAEYTAVLIMRGVAVLAMVIEGRSYWKIKEPVDQISAKRQSLLDILLVPFRHPRYLLNVLIVPLWGGFTCTIPYYSTYIIADAKISYTFLGIVGILAIPGGLIMAPFWNQMVRKYGWFRPMAISMILCGVSYGLNGLVNEHSHWIYVVSAIFYAFVYGGYSLGGANLPYHNAPKEGLSSCLAFYSTFGSIMGLVGTWAGKWFVRVTDGKMITVFGLTLKNTCYASFIPFFGSFLVAGLVMMVYVLDKKKSPVEVSDE